MDLHIDRLTLRLSGISEADGRQLGRLIGDGIAAAPSPVGAHARERMDVAVAHRPGEPLESMAQRIVAEMLRGLVSAP